MPSGLPLSLQSRGDLEPGVLMRQFRFSPTLPLTAPFTIGDGLILLAITTLVYAGARLAFRTPAVIAGPEISLSPLALPWYGLLSVVRMAAAYFLSLLFSLFYGYAAARNRTARSVLMPLLDVLQSIPILSFLPVVLLSLSAFLPQAFAAEAVQAALEQAVPPAPEQDLARLLSGLALDPSGPDLLDRLRAGETSVQELTDALGSSQQNVSKHLGVLAQAEQERIIEAARTGRILVTTRSLPDGFDIPRPFAHAPRERVERLLARYREAGEAGRQVTAALAPAAEATGAPSRVLTIAAAATGPSRDREGTTPNGSARPGVSPDAEVVPGPVERTLRDLGITHPDMLQRSAEIDQASARLIIGAAGELPAGQRRPAATELSRSAGSAEVVNHALASGDPRAAALLRPAAALGREPSEREPGPAFVPALALPEPQPGGPSGRLSRANLSDSPFP